MYYELTANNISFWSLYTTFQKPSRSLDLVYSPFFNVFTCDGIGMRPEEGGLNRMM